MTAAEVGGLSESSHRRRSQRVPLQVLMLIRVNMPDGRCIQMQAFTSSVNAHGGLLESPVKLAANQKLLLINPHSGAEAGGRVIRVEGPFSALYEVAFEFDRTAPRFWPIDFPPEDWALKEEATSDNR
jgi:hypothetical protein